MRTDAGRASPRFGRRAAALLGLLFLAAVATSRAAAIHGPLPPAATQGHSQARRTNDDNLCAKKFNAGTPPLHPELDPLHKYLPQPPTVPPPVVLASRGEALLSEDMGLALPEGCEDVGRVGYKTLRCKGANMTQIPDLSLQRNVDSLVFVETGIQVVSDVSKLPRSVRALTFSNGPLITFNGQRLYQISGLETLSLEHNPLNTWSFITAFYSTDAPFNVSLHTLSLQYNLITYPPQPVGANESVLPDLETLVMSHNPLYNLPSNLFQPLRASSLKQLFLRNCSLLQLPKEGSPLEPVYRVEVLDLSYNPGLSVEELLQLFTPLNEGHLRELHLANNNYVTVPTEALAKVSEGLQFLDLHGSAFQCLDNTSFPLLPQLKHFNLMYCRIAVIRPDTFEVFPVLEELNLDGNALVTVPAEVLLPTLKVLTLSDNPRSTGDDATTTFTMEFVDFGQMQQLSNVTFEGVPLDHIEVQFFNDLHGLLDLRLTSCKIRYIEPFSFMNLTHLQRLYLNNNELEVLLNDTFTGLTSLTHLDLSDNKIVFKTDTEASLTPAPTQWLRAGKDTSRSATLLDLPRVVTSWLQGSKDLDSSYEGGERTGRQSQSKTFLPFADLATLEHLDLSNNGIRILKESQWKDLRQLVKLSLKNNNVMEWYSTVFSNLSHLSELVLSYNSLSLVTEDMLLDFSLSSLQAVDLSHNAFQCDCSLSRLFSDINTSVFVEFSTYRCSLEGNDLSFEYYISTVTCSPEAQDVTGNDSADRRLEIILISISLLLSVVTTVTLYRKRWYLRYLVYKVKMKTDHFKEDVDHYLYDIFVCYSQADRQWVFEHLVTKLEDGGRYRVCVHERDFTVGKEITENIITAVDRSHKVVVVLSPAFVDSSWCMFELQLASHKILDERKNKLILVLLEALPSHRQPKKLRFLLRSRTYLAWHADPEGQRLFWVRLQRAVTKPTVREDLDLSTHL